MKLITFIIWALLTIGCQSKKPEIKKSGLEGQPMPAIELIAIDSTTHINTKNIKNGKPTLLIAFEPWCPYCRAQTKSIVSQIQKLKDVNIYMSCTSQYSEFKEFYSKYQLNKYPNIQAGIDYRNTFASYFRQVSIPFLAIYDSDKRLKQVMEGKKYVNTILDAISD